MKTTDLMIGDWVLDPDNKPAKVEILNIKESIQTARPNGMVCLTHCYRIDPIPLTEEILVKNGFKKSDIADLFEYNTEYYEITIHLFSDGIWIIMVDDIEFSQTIRSQMSVSYVHQLQQTLRLCGIEKEIML